MRGGAARGPAELTAGGGVGAEAEGETRGGVALVSALGVGGVAGSALAVGGAGTEAVPAVASGSLALSHAPSAAPTTTTLWNKLGRFIGTTKGTTGLGSRARGASREAAT